MSGFVRPPGTMCLMTDSSKSPKPLPSAADDGYPVASVAVDPVVITIDKGKPVVLLWQRADYPCVGEWALPGVFMDPTRDVSLEAAARRALGQKVGLDHLGHLEQVFAWHRSDRDPRGWWVVVIAYFSFVPPSVLCDLVAKRSDLCLAQVDLQQADHDERVLMHSTDGVEIVTAFDHADILKFVFRRIQGRLTYESDLALNLLPAQFTLRELQQVYETLLGRKLNKPSFRRAVTTNGLVEATTAYENSVDHRPATLYRRGRARHLTPR
jgi:8-oxo-dGTP diphosphatase